MFGNKIRKLIEKRDQQWKQISDRILKELQSPTLVAIKQFISELRGPDAANALVFTTAEIIMHEVHGELLIVYGRFEYKGNDTVTNDEGEQITLTEEEAYYMCSPMQVTVPLNLTDNANNVPKIVAFLKENYEQAAEKFNNIMDYYRGQLDENTSGDYRDDYLYNLLEEVSKPEEPDEPLDMDLSEFSEEDQISIKQTYKKSGKTLH